MLQLMSLSIKLKNITSCCRWRLQCIFLLSALMAASAVAQAEQSTPQQMELRSGMFLLSPSAQPPNQGAWQNVALPDIWPMSRYDAGDNGWYRFTVHLNEIPQQSWGIYLPRINMNVAVYLNSVKLGDGGHFTEPMTRNWNRPLYFSITPDRWHVGKNIIFIRLKSYPGYGRLDPFRIGPEELLQPVYDTHVFIQNDINRAMFFATLLVGLFMLGIWFQRRKSSMYLWFALTALTWSLFTSNTVLQTIPTSAKTWDWITYSCTAWWTVLLAIFTHRIANIKRPRREYFFLLWATLSTLAYALADLRIISQTTVIWQVGSIAIGFIVVWQLLFEPQRERHIRFLGFCIALVLLTGIHDWLLQSNLIARWWSYGNHLLPYSAPLLLLYIAWYLTKQFINALNETEVLNRELEQRVEAAQQALSLSYAQRREGEMRQAAAGERERIYRDLHDDVGAKLLGMAISAQRANRPREADLARSAMQDLRDVVSRSAKLTTPLGDLLADWRAETEQRVHAAGIALDWRIPATEQPLPISAAAALNMSRILRETISNMLRHARASHVMVDLSWQEEKLILTVQDNGVGLPESGAKSNRGMSSMRARATALGGHIDWRPVSPNGCKVVVEISLPYLGLEYNAA
jgi:signal transduction histidine kinase